MMMHDNNGSDGNDEEVDGGSGVVRTQDLGGGDLE